MRQRNGVRLRASIDLLGRAVVQATVGAFRVVVVGFPGRPVSENLILDLRVFHLFGQFRFRCVGNQNQQRVMNYFNL